MKKKVNPKRKPLANSAADVKDLTAQIINNITLLAWAEVFGALADFPYVTQEGMWDLWHRTNKPAGIARSHADVQTWISRLEELTGICLPYAAVSSADIHTQGDLKRFARKQERNALSSAYAIIARPLIEKELLPLQDIQRIFQKADSLNAEIEEKRITVEDIQGMLEEELGLRLTIATTGVKLMKIVNQ